MQQPHQNLEPPFQLKLGLDQRDAIKLVTKKDSPSKYFLFYGGSGSGKSFLIQYLILLRAMRAPGSRHAIFRATLSSCETTLFNLTLKETIEYGFPPGALGNYKINKSDYSIELPNGSMIFYDGLNDEVRMSKVLGDSFQTIWMNECNEFNYNHVSQLISRLRGDKATIDGRTLKRIMFFDCNPASQRDWEYKAFIQHINPVDGTAQDDPEEWAAHELRTIHNLDNVGATYIEDNRKAMSAAHRLRYIEGRWASDTTGSLFKQADIDAARLHPPKGCSSVEQKLTWLEEQGHRITEISTNVDPATTDGAKSDLTGIMVEGKARIDGFDHLYVLEDGSGKYTPEAWSQVVTDLYHKWGCNMIVAEQNQGGQMVRTTIQLGGRNLPVELVNANVKTGGKTQRAGPVSKLYELGRVHHVGVFPELEQQLTEYGTKGASKSPDRMDALVWGAIYLAKLGDKVVKPGFTRIKQATGLWR